MGDASGICERGVSWMVVGSSGICEVGVSWTMVRLSLSWLVCVSGCSWSISISSGLLPAVRLAIPDYSDPSPKDVARFWEVVSYVRNSIDSRSSFIGDIINFLMMVMYTVYSAMLSNLSLHLFFLGIKGYVQKWDKCMWPRLSRGIVWFKINIVSFWNSKSFSAEGLHYLCGLKFDWTESSIGRDLYRFSLMQ